MCPSYMVTRDEEHSTRGRANALRAAMSGALPPDALTSKRLYEVLDLCLECKACKSECPSNVDMAKLKYEFLDGYHRANGQTLSGRIFGNIATLSRWGSFFAPISNWTLRSETLRDLLESQVGIDRRRPLPLFASQTFVQWFKARGGSPESADNLVAEVFQHLHGSPTQLGMVVVGEGVWEQHNLPIVGGLGRATARFEPLNEGLAGKGG